MSDAIASIFGSNERTAERMAVERSNPAVIVALTPSCVASFMQQPNAAAKLAEFRKIDSWKQRQFVEEAAGPLPAATGRRTQEWRMW